MWIYQSDLEEGIEGFPPLPKTTLAKARKNQELEWLKVGREIVYKKEWIQKWLNSNIRPVSTQTKAN